MNELVHYFARLNSIGPTLSNLPFCVIESTSTQRPNNRVKEQLRSGVLAIAGDQWPVFLYTGYEHSVDSKDHWEGLFRSSLLVKVCFITYVDHQCLNFF